MSNSSNDSGDLSLSCSVSSIENEESEVSEVEGDLETVVPYQFEPDSSESNTEADHDDSEDEERLRNRDW